MKKATQPIVDKLGEAVRASLALNEVSDGCADPASAEYDRFITGVIDLYISEPEMYDADIHLFFEEAFATLRTAVQAFPEGGEPQNVRMFAASQRRIDDALSLCFVDISAPGNHRQNGKAMLSRMLMFHGLLITRLLYLTDETSARMIVESEINLLSFIQCMKEEGVLEAALDVWGTRL